MKIKWSVLLLITSILCITSYVNAESLESFVTQDGRHFCSPFNDNEFRLCSELGIEYENGEVIKGERPFFTTDNRIATIEWKKICVIKGKEYPYITKCDNTYFKLTDNWDFNCVIKDGDETCTLVQWSKTIRSTNQNNYDSSDDNNATSSSSCSVNGKEVDCDEMTKDIGKGIKSVFRMIAVWGIIGLLFTIFWIMMLVHAISKPIPNKVLWILVIVLLSPIGAIVYYFSIKRHFNQNTTPQSIPYAMNVGITYNEWITTQAPQAQTPQAQAPQAQAPQMQAPQAQAPQAQAPQAQNTI